MASNSSLPPPPPVPEIRPVNNELSGYGLNSQVMLTTILCFLFVAALVSILHLYARYILGRGLRRPTALHLFDEGAAPGQTARGGAGLDPATVADLPTFAYGRDEVAAAATGPDRECAVCLSTMEEVERARLLPNCRHAFHVACIDKWLLSHSTCPLCRRNADPAAEKAVGARASASPPPPVPEVGESDASSVAMDVGAPVAEEGRST